MTADALIGALRTGAMTTSPSIRMATGLPTWLAVAWRIF
jgi:hypothetical protein